MHLSWLDPQKMRKVTVVGRDKMAVFDDMESERKLTVHDKGPVLRPASEWQVRTGDIHIPKVANEEPLRIECRHFVSLVEGSGDRLEVQYDGPAVVHARAAPSSLDRTLRRLSVAETAVVYPGTVLERPRHRRSRGPRQAAGALTPLDGFREELPPLEVGPGRSSRPAIVFAGTRIGPA